MGVIEALALALATVFSLIAAAVGGVRYGLPAWKERQHERCLARIAVLERELGIGADGLAPPPLPSVLEPLQLPAATTPAEPASWKAYVREKKRLARYYEGRTVTRRGGRYYTD